MRIVWTNGGTDAVDELRTALHHALDGGPAVLPLDPRDPTAADLAAAMAPDEAVDPGTAVLMPTSGSSGPPKAVLLSAPALLASAHATHARLAGPGHWLLATPAHYIGGLQVLVRARLAGTCPVILDTSRPFHPQAFEDAARELFRHPGPHYTALVPTQLARLLDAGGAAAAGFTAVLIGGAALSDDLRERAEAAGITVVPSYGMSETAGGCVYDGLPLDGVRVRLGEDDRIEISGAVLAHGYRLRPEDTAAAFTDNWFRTGDVGRIGDDGRLEVLGRIDDVINTGGVKIAARTVEQALARHPAVQAACVVGLPDPEWGEIVAAAVVPHDHPPEVEALRETVRTHIGAPGVPKVLHLIRELPLIGPGKPDRYAVRHLLQTSTGTRARHDEE